MRNYLLDTSALLHFTRSSSPVALQIEQDYGIMASAFRPSLCVVTLGEIEAFGKSWGSKRLDTARQILSEFTIVDINHWEVLDAYGVLHSENKSMGLNIGHNDLWIASASMATMSTLISADGDFLRLVTGPDMVIVNAKTGITEHKTI